jgi:O-antigen/teichoic acid export membrane protein
MGKYRRLGKNTLLVFIGNAGAKVIGLLMLPFYTRWLSVEDYGTTDIINVYVSLLLGLVTACIADAVFVFPKDQSVEKQKSYFSSGLCFTFLSLGLTAFLFKIASSIFTYKEISNSFTDNVWFVYGLLVSSFLQQYIQQFVRSINKMKIYSTTGIVLTVSTAVFSFFIIPKWGVSGYVFALILAHILAAVYSAVFSGAFKYFSIKAVKKNTCVEMLKYSVPLIPNGMMWWLVGAFNRPLMEKHLGMHAVGIFAVANKFPGILSMIFSIFSISWQISVLEEFGKAGYADYYNKIFRLLVSGLVFIFFIIVISSKFIVGILTTDSFYESWKYIPILTLGVILSSVSGFAGSTFSASRESKFFFYSSVWGAVSSIVCNVILIQRLGIMGAAISVVVSFAVMSVSRIAYSLKYVKITNSKVYVLMFLISVLTIVFAVSIHRVWLKYSLMACLFILLVYMNLELKEDFLKLYQEIKSKWR